MPEIRDYSPLAASNTATPPNGWAIGTVAALYGGIVREFMARVRRWWSDMSGVAVSTGSGGAYAVATAQAGATRVCWFANHANPNSGPTFNNGTGDREMIYADGATLPAQAIKTGQLVEVVWDSARSKWATFLVPASQFAGTVSGSQLSLTGQQQGSLAVFGSSGWYAGAVGTVQQYWRGGTNPGWATPTGLPGQAIMMCRILPSTVIENKAGMPYTATVSRLSTGVYRLLFTPNLPSGYMPFVSSNGGGYYIASIQNSPLAGQMEIRFAENGAPGTPADLSANQYITVAVY